jgi:hypothetical protein
MTKAYDAKIPVSSLFCWPESCAVAGDICWIKVAIDAIVRGLSRVMAQHVPADAEAVVVIREPVLPRLVPGLPVAGTFR